MPLFERAFPAYLNVCTGAVVPPSPSSGAANEILTDLDSFKLYRIAAPAPGMWSLAVNSNARYSVTVTASSIVDFVYSWVELVYGAYPGYRKLDGKPLSGI